MVDIMQHGGCHINRTTYFMVLVMITFVIVANYVENPYLLIIIGDRSNDRKK